jgi:hypothetical protein
MFKCNNNGKKKSNSFKVWDDNELLSQVQPGVGSSEEEALSDYMDNLKEHIGDLIKYVDKQLPLEKQNIHMVNCFGDLVDNENS